jgi:D-glycero-alpha-D-manno-heptose-7-phosphate kinase
MQISRSGKTSVKAIAPTRIDLAGGTLDLWPIHHLLKEKSTINLGISLNAQTTCTLSNQFSIKSIDLGITQQGTFREIIENPKIPIIGVLLEHFWTSNLPAISIETKAQSPAGAGIGGSSCLGITIASALNHLKNTIDQDPILNSEELVKIVQDAESKLIKSPTGVQDYWGAVRGNLNIIEFPFGKTEIQTISGAIVDEIGKSLILVYSGQSRSSAINNWEIFKNLYDGDLLLLEKISAIGNLAYKCAQALRNGDLDTSFQLSKNEWELRKSLWPTIETPTTQKIDTISRDHGAYFSRVCGAGGGGIMAIFAPQEKKLQIIEKIKNCGGLILDARIANYGLTVTKES